MERRPSLKDMGRKLGTKAERLEKEASRRQVVIEDTVTTDDQISRCFHSYARRVDNNEPSLNPMQFSTIWRLITGEKGNLFKEMQMFQKYVLALSVYMFNICAGLMLTIMAVSTPEISLKECKVFARLLVGPLLSIKLVPYWVKIM